MRAKSLPEIPTPPMLATRSLLFNALFYLNMVVLMIVGLPTMLFGRRAIFALQGSGARYPSGFWRRSAG